MDMERRKARVGIEEEPFPLSKVTINSDIFSKFGNILSYFH